MTEAKPAPNERLRHERIRRGWSQQDLADRVGTTPVNVGRWERGITTPGPYLRQKLSEVYEKSLEELGLLAGQGETEQADVVKMNVPPAASAQTAPSLPTSFWNVPYNRNLLFTGREDTLAHLHDTLLSGEQPVALAQPQAISGLGGVGKTQTAIEYAYRYRDNYDSVLWARADSTDVLVSDFLLMAALLHLPQRNDQDQNEVVNAVLRWFDTHEGWLLILDNADHLEPISQFIPPAGKGHVLLTTRANSTGTVAQRVELDTMALDEGVLFLLRRAKLLKGSGLPLETLPDATRSQARAIVEAVDGLPLALDQAGAYIEETGCSLNDYLKFYRSRRNRLLRTRGASASGHPEPVATTWSLSFEKVERANPAAAELLRLCAFLHPDEIPEAMILAGASEPGSLLQSIAEDELDWNEAIGELRKYSLVKRDADLKLLNMHRLVQVVLIDAMDEQTQRAWAERTVRIIQCAFPDAAFAKWPLCQQYLPHALACVGLVKRYDVAHRVAAQLFGNAGSYLKERGQLVEAEQLLHDALALSEQYAGPEHPETAVSLNKLAELYLVQGKYPEGESCVKRAVAICEQALPPDHPITAQNIDTLAVIYYAQGRYSEAEPLFSRALSIREQVLGDEDSDTIYTLSNLSVLYYAVGQYEKAIPLCERALATRKRLLGLEHPETAYSINDLATLFYAQGRYSEAEPLMQQCLLIRQRVLGPEHHFTAYSMNNLAVVYRVQGKYEQVEPLLMQALAIRQKSLGPEHPEVAYNLKDLADFYQETGEYARAEAFYQDGLAGLEQAIGAAHPHVISLLENYAKLLHKLNRTSEAEEMEARIQALRATPT